jgi:hypothetical protein
MVKKLSFAGGCLWCYQQHKCTPQYASEVGRRKMQGMCSSLSLNYMYLEPMQAKPDTSFSLLWYIVYVCQSYNCEMPSWVSCWNQFICIHHLKLTLDFWTVIVAGSSIIILQIMTTPPFPASLLCNFLQVIFLETICNDRSVIDTNIRLKIQQSPDYADM